MAQHVAEVVVRAGRGEQVDRVVQVARERHPTPALHLAPVAGIEVAGQPLDHTGCSANQPCSLLVTSGSCAMIAARSTPPGPPSTASSSLWSAPPRAATIGDDPTVVGAQRGQHLLGQEVVDVGPGGHGAQLDQGGPAPQSRQPLDRHLAQGGERRQVVVAEGQVALVQPLDPSLGRQPGQRDRGIQAPAQHQVAVGRQRTDQRAQQVGAAGAGAHLVHVVDHQAHLAGRALPHLVGQRRGHVGGRRLARRGHAGDVGAERGGQAVGQAPRGIVARTAAQPAVVAAAGDAFSSRAWASSDDLPNPAPAASTVTGRFHRPCTRRSRSLRLTRGRPAEGRGVAVGPRHEASCYRCVALG